MTLKDFLEKHGEVKITKEQEKQLKEILGIKENKNSKRWKSKNYEYYYYIRMTGNIDCFTWNGGNIDTFLYLTNNCFKTGEEAEFHLEKLKVYHELQLFADEHNEKIDWNNIKQTKYVFLFDYKDNKIIHDTSRFLRRMGSIYFSSKELAEQAIKKVGEDRIKKYLFGVEDENN